MGEPSKIANPSYTPVEHPVRPFRDFNSFYPFYLGEHSDRRNRVLHLLGTSFGVAIDTRIILAIVPVLLRRLPLAISSSLSSHVLELVSKLSLSPRQVGRLVLAQILFGYAFAWVGHFFVERNRPATFKYPVFSLRGDFRMLWEVVTRQRSV